MASKPSEAVVALGRKLVEHLEFESDNDLLAGWMSHYLAERMLAVETAAPDDRAALEKQCAEAILEFGLIVTNSCPPYRPLLI